MGNTTSSTFLKLISRTTKVSSLERVSKDFILFSLSGHDLQNKKWTPGDKVQIIISGWSTRTYTPFSYDPFKGEIQMIAFLNKQGIGSEWLENLKIDDECLIYGPRKAIDLSVAERPLILFGDETSVGTALALQATPLKLKNVRILLEIDNEIDIESVSKKLKLNESVMAIPKLPEEEHIAVMADQITEVMQSNSEIKIISTGKSMSILKIQKALRAAGISSNRISNSVYWAPGKKGLD